jgi:site-specific DNA recombinase
VDGDVKMHMAANNLRTPAVAYLRRSTDRQEQSIADQRFEIERWADENAHAVVREYVDDAISGTSAEERPGFQKMIADARRGDFKAVIVWNSDRFSRGDVTETEYFRYLLRKSGVRVLSVTEDYLARDGIDGDVLRTVKQFQNRQYSISLSQNTLRGQISSVMAESDPGRAAPYGYDREILAPDGSILFRIRFCPGRVREVYDKDGKFQARYGKGQALSKPGKECKARLVLSDEKRVQVVKDIFAMCLDGIGYASIAAELNRRGVPASCSELWNFSSIKSILENPTYRGDLVWNRRTEAKFFRLLNGRTQQRRRQVAETKVIKTKPDDWLVVPDAVPAIISRADWEKAQSMVKKRSRARGGAGHRNRRWLLTGVLKCGDCGHKFWGEARHKGRIKGRAPVVTNYYCCSGRRAHGKEVCPTPSTLRAEKIESWLLDKLQALIATDEVLVDEQIDRLAAMVGEQPSRTGDAERIRREIKEVQDLVTALTTSIDPANLALLNDRLTQLRKRKERLEEELKSTERADMHQDVGALRAWARRLLTGLRDAMAGKRDDSIRNVMSAYIDRITVWPSRKCGEVVLNPAAHLLWKHNDRPKGRSRVNHIGATGFEPATSWSQTTHSNQTELRPAACCPLLRSVPNVAGAHKNGVGLRRSPAVPVARAPLANLLGLFQSSRFGGRRSALVSDRRALSMRRFRFTARGTRVGTRSAWGSSVSASSVVKRSRAALRLAACVR